MSNLYLNQSLMRGLGMLRYIAAHNGHATMTEIANALHMDKATTRRFLATLQESGYIHMASGRKAWSITLEVLELGYAALSGLEWREIAKLELEKLFVTLAKQPGTSVSMSILKDSDVLYLVRLETPGFLPRGLSVGVRRPAFASSMGKIILAMLSDEDRIAQLDQIQFQTLTDHTVLGREELEKQLTLFRAREYSISDREVSAFSRSLAIPIMRHGRVLAAAAVAAQAERMSLEEFEAFALEPLRHCVKNINTALDHAEL